VVEAENDNCDKHRQRFQDIEHPLVLEWVSFNPQGELNETVNTANLGPSQPSLHKTKQTFNLR
jgi:hypothetical protein